VAVNSVLAPYPSFFDAAGDPLENGFIYIGEAGFEARSTPKASFFDVAQTIPTGTASGAAIRTKAGFPVNTSNAPAMFYVDGDFSISVCDRNGVLLYSALNMTLALNVGAAVGPVLWADGNLGAVGGGFANESNTGFIRPSAGVMQTVVAGVLVSQQSAGGTVFNQPVSGTGFVSGVSAALDADLTALAGIATNGILARTGVGTAAARTITAGAGVSVTNGDGVAGNPTITTGARVLLASKTASASATVDFTEFNNAVYRYYEFEMENVKPATDAVDLVMRVSTNAGVSYDAGASDYSWASIGMVTGGIATAGSSGGATAIGVSFTNALGNAAAERGLTGNLKVYNAGDAAQRTRVVGQVQWDDASGSVLAYATLSGRRTADQDTDAIRFLMTSGNIASGVIRMYGVPE
jgi:hypothetical protein